MTPQLSQPSRANGPMVIAAIPCFNTRSFIANVVFRASKYVDQVIVINDGSHDGTAKAAKTAGALMINHDRNTGYGEAVKSCFEAAKARAYGLKIREVATSCQYHPSSSTMNPVIHGLMVALSVIKIRLRRFTDASVRSK